MGVPIAIFIVLLAAGVLASTQWLPDLAPGPVGAICFFAVCGLVGAALAVLGLHLYGTIEEARRNSGTLRITFLTADLTDVLFEPGVLLALALGVYLLAPGAEGAQPSAGASSAPASDPGRAASGLNP